MNKHINHYLTSGDPWMIHDGWLEKIHAIANREHDYQAVLAQRGDPLNNTRTVEKRGSVAIIPLTGAIFPRANMMTELSGATSLQMFALDYNAALNDPSITAIIINADSPGGVTTLVNETANMLRNSQKKTVTYVNGLAASAMYYIASGSHEIVMDAMAMVGSVGVVTQIRGKRDDGTLDIVSSNAPDKRPDPSTPEGQAVHQKLIDDLESVFINAVAEFRNLTPEQVIAQRGGLLVGQKAVDAGFADRLGSLESLITELNNTQPTTLRRKPVDLATLKAEHPALYSQVLEEGKVQAQTESQASASNERNRVGAILNSEEAKGRETLANHIAFNTAMTVDEAKTMLAASPVQTAQTNNAQNQFAQHMQNLNPNITTDNDEANTEASSAKAIADIVNIARGLN